MKRKIIGIGAGGHAKVVIDAFRLRGEFEFYGLLDSNRLLHGKTINGVLVLGDDALLPSLYRDGIRHVFIGIGGIADMSARQTVYDKVVGLGFEVAGVRHPCACISPSAIIEDSVQVMACAVINADARIGKNVIVNTGAIVEHGCNISMNVHVASGAIVTGGVTVGPGAFIGAGAVIKNSVNIGARAVVGAGAAVIRDVPDNIVVAGVPARPIRL